MADATRPPEGGPDMDPAKIHTQGISPGRELSPADRGQALTHAVAPDLAALHVRSVVELDDLPEELQTAWPNYTPTTLHHWQHGDQEEWQLRVPEKYRKDNGPKYLFPKGAEPPLNQVRDDGRGPVLFVEGSWQHLSAATWASPEFAIYGMDGCYGWSKADLSFVRGREVYANFDADQARNADVWDAAAGLKETAEAHGATKVLFVKTPGTAKDGLDDFLAKITDPSDRRETFKNMIKRAAASLGRRPAQRRKKPHTDTVFDEQGQLKTMVAAKAVFEAFPMRLTLDKRVAIYRGGVYRPDEEMLMGVVAELLRDDHRTGHYSTIKQAITGILAMGGLYLPERLDRPLVNVRNGLVDLETGELLEHDPELATSVQFPITYDPEATCPTLDAWAKDIIGDQLADLLEATAPMLDPTMTPHKALLLFGPSRSGKSTYLRLLQAMVGKENTSGVSLHQLADDRFAAARVYGKVLNSSADLSAGHIEDLSMFKMLTGEDLIAANPKYGKPFDFINRALFAFSANEVPSVGESSRAYSERIKPFRFGTSFAGREDHQIELDMLKELPGIFNHLVRAWQARRDRGRELTTDAAVRQEFEQASDRVSQWVAEEMVMLHEYGGEPVADGVQLPAEALSETSDGKSLRTMFEAWAEANGVKGMGRNTLINRLTSKNGVVRVRVGPTRRERFAIRRRRDGENPEGSEAFTSTVGHSGDASQIVERSEETRVWQKPPDPPDPPDPPAADPCPGCSQARDHDPYSARCTRLATEVRS
jgi:putative DNA primase/helicase